MQHPLEIPQEAYVFLRNFRLRAGDSNREGGSRTAPFTHPLPGVPTPLAGILILQQTQKITALQRGAVRGDVSQRGYL